MEVIAAGIEVLRPRTDVTTCGPNELEGEIERFEPQVIICRLPSSVDSGDRPAWVELALEPGRPSRVRVGRRWRESSYLLLEDLLAVVDEAEELVRKEAGSRERTP